ncbi:MAG: efflux RND transporter permease subunit [Bryobacteraceae bacterium]|nr:efflux RND transporter permease subunit [Bryobacteraceae bacterium]
MNPVKSALRYPQVTLLLTAAVLATGVTSLVTMPRREDPKITIRTGLVIAMYPGATAEQVESQVTRKIEQRLFRFEEVRKAKTWSTSRSDLCVIHVELEDHVQQPDVFWSKLRHALIELKLSELPEGVRGPFVRDDFGDTVALLVAVHGRRYSYTELKEYAERLEDEFRTVRAVAKLKRIGEQKEEIRITSSMERVAQYALSPMKVIQALQGRNVVAWGGELKTGQGAQPMRATGLFQDVEEIRRVMIDISPTGQPVYLGDLARVERVEGEPRSLVRYNGEPAVLVSVEMQEGYNIVDFGRELRRKLAGVRAALPPDLEIDILADQPAVVERRITHFIREFGIAISAVILVTIVLLPFRVALISSLAIPVTIAATFALLHAIGVELHQVSISALIVVLGMVVDDAIVIADNYVEHLDRGTPRMEAAWRCATELWLPVLTATLTIIAAFLPMLIISGAVGEFIRALPVAVAVALACSYAVAMLVTPWLCRYFIRRGLHPPEEAGRKRRFSAIDFMQAGYYRVIRAAMRNKAATLAGGAAVFALGLGLLAFAVPQRFFPTAERNQFVIHLWLPEGSRLEKTDAVVRRVEKHLRKEPLVTSFASFVGDSAPRFYYNVDPEFPARNYAQMVVNTRSAEDTPPLVFRLRRELGRVAPEALVIVRELEQGTVMKAPVEARIVSTRDGPEDLKRLRALGEQAGAVLRRTPGAEYVYDDFHEDAPELSLRVNEEVANRLGFSNALLALQMAGGFSGLPVTTFWEGDRDVPVVLRLDEEYRSRYEDVEDAYVVSALTGARVPLRSVAEVEPEWRPSRIVRRNGLRTLTVMAIPDAAHLPSEILKAARKELEKLPFPEGYRLEFGGEIEGQNETFSEMHVVLALSILFIFLILLFQFRSPVDALVVMMSIPLALPGAVFGLMATGNPFSFTAFMGIISLSGVVVRNAIILVDFIHERRAAGADLETAATEAGERRLRPIFLTTAAAAVGVLPMILSGSSLWSPLASAIAVGLICSMFFTLVVAPVLFVTLKGRTGRWRPSPGATLALALAVLLPGVAQGAPRRITLDEAVEMARKQNAILKIQALKIRESEKKREAARTHFFPRLSNESSLIYNSQLQNVAIPRGFLGVLPPLGPLPPEDLRLLQGANTFGLAMTTLGQPVTQLVKIHEGAAAAAQDVRIAEEERRRAENEVVLKVREAYLTALVLERRLEAARAQAAAAEAARADAAHAVETGAALEVKRMEADARLLEAKNRALGLEMQLADVKAELADLMGLEPDEALELEPAPWSAPPLPAAEELTAQALARHPEVKAAEAAVEKARRGVRAAQADYIPEISVFATHAQQRGVPFLPSSNAAVGARLSWEIFDWGRKRAAVGERAAQLGQAEENLRRVRSRVRIEVEKARRKVERMEDLVRVAEQALAARREALRITTDAVEAGVAAPAERERARAALAEAEAQAEEARTGLRLAWAELERALGG